MPAILTSKKKEQEQEQEQEARLETPVLVFTYGNYSIRFSPLNTRHTLHRFGFTSFLFCDWNTYGTEQRYGNPKGRAGRKLLLAPVGIMNNVWYLLMQGQPAPTVLKALISITTNHMYLTLCSISSALHFYKEILLYVCVCVSQISTEFNWQIFINTCVNDMP